MKAWRRIGKLKTLEQAYESARGPRAERIAKKIGKVLSIASTTAFARNPGVSIQASALLKGCGVQPAHEYVRRPSLSTAAQQNASRRALGAGKDISKSYEKEIGGKMVPHVAESLVQAAERREKYRAGVSRKQYRAWRNAYGRHDAAVLAEYAD